MIVYVESNFILELAESNEIELVLPAFSIGESYEAWVRHSKRRKITYDTLVIEISELSRSKPYKHFSEKFKEINEILLKSRVGTRKMSNEKMTLRRGRVTL
jgi:hypothetical protein